MSPQKLQLSSSNAITVLAFGDSLTEGYTDFGLTFHPYAANLELKLLALLRNFKISIDVNGVSGDTVLPSLGGRFLSRLNTSCPLPKKSDASQAKTSPPKYDVVVVLGGTNDLAYKINDTDGATEIFAGLQNLYEHVLASGASLICVTIPERAFEFQASTMAKTAREARLQLNQMITDYVHKHANDDSGITKVFLFDLAPIVPASEDDEEKDVDERIWSPDGLHMTEHGYDVFGEELAGFIHRIVQGAGEDTEASAA